MLPHHVEVYVPGTVNANQPAPAEFHKQQLTHVKTQLAKMFGGFTAVPAHGGWHSEQHGLIEEPVTVVRAHMSPEQRKQHLPAVFDLARQLARTMGQEAIAVNVDGTMHFVEPSQEGANGT